MTVKKWTADQKLEVVLAGLRNEGRAAELCRRYGISHSTFPTGPVGTTSGAGSSSKEGKRG